MRRLLALLAFSSTFLQAQTVLFEENFDLPSGPDSVITYNTNLALSSTWNDTNQFFTSSNQSYHAKITNADTVIFETSPFSTLGLSNVSLTFNHICKILFLQKAFVQVSVDSGNTWVNLDTNHYNGNSLPFTSLFYFNELSYPQLTVTPYWGGITSSTNNVSPNNSWFAEEEFNISAIAGVIHSNNDTGYADVRVRWVLAHTTSWSIQASGWYVDDIVIKGAPCELEAPKISFSAPTMAKPIGARYQATETVKLRASDANNGDAGINNVDIHYSINGGTWTTSSMIKFSSLSCPDSSDFSYTFTNLTVNDTVDWYVEAFDCACPNSKRDPVSSALPNYYSFWRVSAPPSKCGPLFPNSFPYIVSSFPWVEDFENVNFWWSGVGTGNVGTSHRGNFPTGNPTLGLNWMVNPSINSAGFAWSVRNFGTGTLNTGPNTDHSPIGINYLYTEASQGSSNNITQLITPCIDLGQVSCVNLEFYLHMYGSEMGNLRVDIDTGSGAASWQNGVWKQIGELQNDPNDPWEKVTISLNDYIGKTIRIRFLGVRGSGDKGDIAIDDIRIYEPDPIDVEMVSILSPFDGLCSYSAADTVKVKLRYQGCNAITKVPMAYSIKHVATGTITTVWDTLSHNINGVFDTNFVFNVLANLSLSGKYKVLAFCDVPGDNNSSNDTIAAITLTHSLSYSGYPYFCNFDNAPWQPGNSTTSNPGTYDTTLFQTSSSSLNSFNWLVGSGATPTNFTGPWKDRSIYGNYLYSEGNIGTDLHAVYVSKCVDLGSMTNPVISFWYHMYGANTSNIKVQIKKEGETQWSLAPGSIVFVPQQSSSKDNWLYKEVSLSAYTGTSIQLRIIATRPTVGSSADMAIDDLGIYDKITTDIGVTNISPTHSLNTPSTTNPVITLRNYGINSVGNFLVKVKITPACGGTPTTYSSAYTSTIAPGAEVLFSFGTVPNYPEGDFEITAYTQLTGDSHAFNDTMRTLAVGRKKVDVSNGYFYDFDQCDFGTTDGFIASGDLNLFKVDSPASGPITNASSSPNCMFLKTNQGAYEEVLRLPRFNGFDSISGGIELHFKHSFSFATGSAGILEYYDVITQTWKTLGNYNSTTSNCGYIYNSSSSSLFNGSPSWVGYQVWQSACVQLPMYNNSSGIAQIRFRSKGTTGWNSYWAIDDVEIVIPKKRNLEMIKVRITTLPTVGSNGFEAEVQLSNIGFTPINDYQLNVAIDGLLVDSSSVTLNNPLNRLSKDNTIITVNNPLTAGPHKLSIWSSKPNGSSDLDNSNDTISRDFEVISNGTYPYCTTFDTGKDFVTKGDYDWVSDSLWEHGNPTKFYISSPYSGAGCWITDLNSNYSSLSNDFLYTKAHTIQQGKCYELSFYQNFKTDNLFDGGNVEYTFDFGKTWHLVGTYGDTNWYNQPFVQGLGLTVPGFTGNSGGWIQSEWTGDFPQGGEIVFRFNFKSNHNIVDEGWAIDNLCFNELSITSCSIGIEENLWNDDLQVYPIPASDKLTITRASVEESMALELLSIDGKVLELINFEKGQNSYDVNVQGYAAGVYLLKYTGENYVSVKKVIIE